VSAIRGQIRWGNLRVSPRAGHFAGRGLASAFGRGAPLAGRASHSLAVLSTLEVMTCEPSGVNAADKTALACPLRRKSSSPVLESHSRAVRSELAVMIREPSGLNDAAWTTPVCPVRVRSGLPVLASHTRAVLSRLPVTTREPSALNDDDVTDGT